MIVLYLHFLYLEIKILLAKDIFTYYWIAKSISWRTESGHKLYYPVKSDHTKA